MIEIQLTKGYTTVIDDEDVDLSLLRWTAREHRNTVYATRVAIVDNKKRFCRLHRMILSRKLGRELLSSELVDHRDRDGLNNRRENLRIADRCQNAQNSKVRADNKSGHRGVSWYKPYEKWQAVIYVNKKRKHIGYFQFIEVAIAAYENESTTNFGDFKAQPHT